MNYWLLKSEPSTFGIDDLKARPKKTEPWDGVRNYQARNMLRDEIKKGDLAFFYHSNCKPPGIVGVVEVVKSGYPDHTAFDPDSAYFDAKSQPQNPRWFMVDVKFVKKFPEIISLDILKKQPELEGFPLLRKGNRLSVMPVAAEHWNFVQGLVKKD